MFCDKCGTQIAENASFCTACGNPVANQVPQTSAYEQPAPQQPNLPMGWFKFLINFALWAGAILNIIAAFPMLTGSQYGTEVEAALVYSMFSDLKILDMLCGILAIALGAFGIYTRFQLAGFKQNGPKLLLYLYAAAVVYNLIYVVGCNMILSDIVLQNVDFTSVYSSTITSAIMIFVNRSYFQKRAHLFVN